MRKIFSLALALIMVITIFGVMPAHAAFTEVRTETATAIGCDLETIMKMNIDKLRKRYPDGFSSDRSKNRKAGDI